MIHRQKLVEDQVMRLLAIFVALQAIGVWMEPAPVFPDQPPAARATDG